MENKDLNFNYSECIKQYDKWGETTYVNICNGDKDTIPWGLGGYGIIILVIIACVCLISLIGLLFKMIVDY